MSAKSKSGLGKGIEALISSDFDKTILDDNKERIQKLFISEITPMSGQPRKHFDEVALAELADSIKRFGILQPLIVTSDNDGKFVLIAGERRWRAAKLAGLKQVPAIVREQKDQEKLEIALIENVQRVDLSPLEQAVSIERLHNEFNMNYTDIAARLGKAHTTVHNIVRLLQLPEQALEALQNGQISEGHARAILALKDDPTKQTTLLEQIIKHGWSVRQAEQFVVSTKQGAKSQTAVSRRMATENTATKKLGSKLHTRVTIKHTARGGRLEIHFKDEDQLKDILGNL